jgi:Na+/proline symporter
VVIALLLALGALVYIYIDYAALITPENGDEAFPMVALQGGLPMVAGIMFILGMVSSTYSAAGSALTSLTTSFVVDIMDGVKRFDSSKLRRVRTSTHCVMALLITALILLFHRVGEGSVINLVFTIAGYTYGPILGMFVFGMMSKRAIRSKYLPVVVVLSPLLSYAFQWSLATYYNYHIGFELLGYNALLAMLGLWVISYRGEQENKNK